MNIENLTKAIIRAADRCVWDEGYDGRQTEPDRTPLDVAIGDKVYFYDEDEGAVIEATVSHEYDGFFYAMFVGPNGKPEMERLHDDWFYRTREDLSAQWLEKAEESLEYHDGLVAALRKSIAFMRTGN